MIVELKYERKIIMLRVQPEKVFQVMKNKLEKYGVNPDIASECAQLLIENSIDGIYSHGINRFPRVISYLEKGYIKPNNKPERIMSSGAFERYGRNGEFIQGHCLVEL